MEPLQWVRLPPEQSSWYTWWIVMKSCALINTALLLVLRSNFIDSVVSAIGLDSQLATVWSLKIFGKARILQFIQFCYQFADRLTKSFASYGKNIRSHLTHVPITPICSNIFTIGQVAAALRCSAHQFSLLPGHPSPLRWNFVNLVFSVFALEISFNDLSSGLSTSGC